MGETPKRTAKGELVSVVTPQRVCLPGLWFGPQKPKRALIFVHGLGSSLFSHPEFALPLIDRRTAALLFDNRGAHTVSFPKKLAPGTAKGYARIPGGAARETFTDCADDLAGTAAFAKRRGAKKIILVGHSTGCQKIVYFLSRRKNQRDIAAAALLAPLSDYAIAKCAIPARALKRAHASARRMAAQNRGNEFLPFRVWKELISASRFLSLYAPGSDEDVFPYWGNAAPKALQKITVPLLAVFADADEFHGRPSKTLVSWFERAMRQKPFATDVIKGALHGFQKKERVLCRILRRWLQETDT